MATSRTEQQLRTLRGCGLSAIDAHDLATWLLRHAPFDADGRWVPTLNELLPSLGLAGADLLRAARIAWYVDAPARYKRLLDPEVER